MQAGDYYIVSALDQTLALDVSGGSMSDGANVQVWTRNQSDAQIWRISERADGTMQVLSRLAGKSMDVVRSEMQAGTNVHMWTDNDGRAQQWDITELGETMTVDGEAHALVKICPTADGTLALDIEGATAASGANAIIWTYQGAANQKWALVPVPAFRSGGVYELRSMMSTGLCADVAGASTANGANVLLWAKNGGNNQKYAIVDEGDGYSIRNIASGKYVDVNGQDFSDGANVQSWEDNDSRAQRWAVEGMGSTKVEGETCLVARIMADNGTAHGGKTYSMDVSGAMASNNANILIWGSHNGDNQRWALLPTSALDEHMPSPFNLASEGKDWKAEPLASGMTFHLVPEWECAPAWATSGPSAFQIRTRQRFMDAMTSTWGEWSEFSAWETAAVTRKGQRSWLTEGVDVEVPDTAKLAQLEFEVRATGVDELSVVHGASASKAITCHPIPNVSLTAAGWSPEGVRLAVTSDYLYGATTIGIESIKAAGRELMADAVSFGKLDDATSVLIGQDSLLFFPEDGAQLEISYTVGTEQRAVLTDTLTASLELSYDSGSMQVEPTFEEGDGISLLATVPNLGTARMWVEVGGDAYECELVESNSEWAVFQVLYPLTGSYRLFAAGSTEDGDQWYTWHAERTNGAAPYHAWNWDGGFLKADYIGKSDSRPSRGYEAVYEANVLDSREYEAVSFAKTKKVRITATGKLSEITDETARDVEAMVGKHALYRSADGDYCQVAVVEASASAGAYWTDVSVSMVREA